MAFSLITCSNALSVDLFSYMHITMIKNYNTVTGDFYRTEQTGM